jgi:uroporphyrinogen-III synthase
MDIHSLEPQRAAPRPLDGIGVVVTRPQRQAAGLAQKLAALGATSIIWPAIVILPPADRAALERAHEQLARYDVAVFVSANAVEYGAPDPARWPSSLAVLAPGPGTAEALAAVGLGPARIPATTFDSEGLLALPELQRVEGKRVLILRGGGGRELLGATLEQRGARVDYVACYRRAAPQSGAAGLVDALREERAHALTLTSSEGLDNLLAAVGAEGRRLLARLPAFVPHPRIAERARDGGLEAIVTAGGDAGLLAGLLEWFAAHPHNARS